MPDQYRRRFENDRRDDRPWHDRAGDEVRSWFGDDGARARRGNDERDDRYPYGGERDRSWQDESGSGGREQRPWRSDERGSGWDRGGQPPRQQYGQGEQHGTTYDRGSYGRGDDRNWQSRGDERSWNRRGSHGDWDLGRGDRWDATAEGPSRWAQRREYDAASRPSSGGYRSDRDEPRHFGGGYDNRGHGDETDSRYDRGPGAGWRRESYFGRGPKDYKRSDDRIREEISDRLTDDHQVDATEISIQVQDGEVTLTGTVPARDQKRRAEDLVESISGVREVTNHLRVNRLDRPHSSEHGLANPLGLAASAGADAGATGATAAPAGSPSSPRAGRSNTST